MSFLYVEVRPGEGGDDAVEFAEELLDTLSKFLERRGWSFTHESSSRTYVLKVSLSSAQRAQAKQQLDALAGTHRVQRVPSSESGRRHTSTATVAVLQDAPAAPVVLREKDLRIDRMRGSGTGGQRRNKVETAVRVTHLPTNIVVVRTSGRSQAANLDDAKAQLQHELQTRAQALALSSQHQRRREQTVTDRSAKDFTHCLYRDEVVRHADGQRWTARAWRQGRLS